MKKLFSIMLGRCFALAFLLFFSGKSFAENDNYTRAADTFKAIEKLYGVEDVPLFRETYPFDNHLKVSYLSNQEQAEQQKLYSYLWPFSGSLYRAQNEMYMGGDRKKREKVCRSKGCV